TQDLHVARAEQLGAVAVGDRAELGGDGAHGERLVVGEIGGERRRVELRGPAVVALSEGRRGGVLPGPGVVREGPGPGVGGGAGAVLRLARVREAHGGGRAGLAHGAEDLVVEGRAALGQRCGEGFGGVGAVVGLGAPDERSRDESDHRHEGDEDGGAAGAGRHRAMVPPTLGRMSRVLHTAQALVDVILEVDALPTRGGNANARSERRYAGGAVTTLLAAARTGAEAVHGGAHGTGPNGDLIREVLGADGVAVSDVTREDADTGYCVVLLEPSAERTFLTVYGAEREVTAESFERL